MFGVLDTLKYLLLGGRIGKTRALLGTLLNVKPLLTIRDGELVPYGLARTRARGIERLFDFVKNASGIQEVAIVHSTTPDEASSLGERVGSIFDKRRIHLARLGPALGVHGGPGALLLAMREKVHSVIPETVNSGRLKKIFYSSSSPASKLRFSYLELRIT